MYGTGAEGYSNTEHYLRRVLVGNIDDVRRRLSIVLERLGYDFVDDNGVDVEARRNATGWGMMSTNVLDYSRVLTIKLKLISENTTQASFIYNIKNAHLVKRDKEIFTREAETIVHLATVRATDKICGVCGVESDGDSRFCRKCGTPMTVDETVVENLKMAGEVNAGYSQVFLGGIFAFIAFILPIIALIIFLSEGNPKAIRVLLIIGSILGLLDVIFLAFGWKRLHNALEMHNNNEPKVVFTHSSSSKTLPDAQDFALPPASPMFSVTDNTTELFGEKHEEFEFVRRKKVNTNKFD